MKSTPSQIDIHDAQWPIYREAAAETADAPPEKSLSELQRHEQKRTSAERTLADDQQNLEARFALAQALHGLNHPKEAIDAYRAVLALAPSHIQAMQALAFLLLEWTSYEEPERLFRALISRSPEDPVAYRGLGEVLREQGRYDEASSAFQSALQLRPNFALAKTGIARVLIENGDLDQARALLNEAMELEPDRVSILRDVVYAGRVKLGDPVVARLESLLKHKPILESAPREQIHFALGKAYQDIGKPEQAFQHLLQGNALRRRSMSYDESSKLAYLETIQRVFDAELFAAIPRECGNPSDAPVFVVGMPRSGSTLVEQILASHPKVFGTGERPEFTDGANRLLRRYGWLTRPLDTIAHTAPEALQGLGSSYLASMRTLAPEAERVVDKMLGNFRYVGLIRLAFPNARIIHTQRNPVDTCLSCFAHRFPRGTYQYTYDLAELGRFYRSYTVLMDHWRKVLSPGVMLDVEYEDVVRDIETAARRIIAHCGLEWNEACLEFHRSARPVRTASVVQVRQPLYKSATGRWRANKEAIQPLLDALAESS